MTAAVHSPGNGQRRWEGLDAVRGIAALLVLLFHCASLWPGFAGGVNPLHADAWLQPWAWLKFTPLRLLVSSGPPAVVLFFVLSGFVLALPFVRGRGPGYAEFAVRRICRIYPPFAAAILVSALLYWLVQPAPVPDSSEWFATATWDQALSWNYIGRNLMMTGLRPDMTLDLNMWSLVHELRISLVFPLLLLLTRRHPWTAALGSLALAVLCTRLLAGQEAADLVWSLVDTVRFVPMFVAGILLASHAGAVMNWVAMRSRAVQGGLWAGVFLLLMFPGQSVSIYYDFIWGIGAVGLIALTIGSVRARALLSASPFRWLGRVSYSLYLIHVPILVAAVHLTHDWLPRGVLVALFIPVALVIAELMYCLTEAPSIRLGRYLAGLTRPDRAVAAPISEAFAGPAGAEAPR